MRRIGVYIFDEVEVLDFAGPFETFSVASRLAARRQQPAPFEVVTIAATNEPVTARGGLVMQPACSIGDHPPLDVVVVPGGVMDAQIESGAVIGWIKRCAEKCEVVASVCTGAFVLGRAGLLDGRTVTTHWEDVDDLRAFVPQANVLEGVKWVDEGDIVTAAGISAGIDMCLHLVARFEGLEFAEATARQMDYRWAPEPGNAVLVDEGDWRATQESLALLAVPGMRESILTGMAESTDDCACEPGW